MTMRRSTWFVLGTLGLTAIGFALAAGPAGGSRGDEAPREQQIKDLEKQVQALNGKLNELKQQEPKAAILNLSYVIKHYKKWKDFQEEYKSALGRFDAQLKAQKEDLDELSKELMKPDLDADRRKQIEKQMKEIQRAMQDKTDEGKQTLAAMEAKQFSEIYKDVTGAAERHANANGIEMVMHYNDGTTDAEVNNPMNIGRKMGQGALFPLYVAPGMDISKDVLTALNEKAAGR
jgi:Skp family chaperone for outer membrane proteins